MADRHYGKKIRALRQHTGITQAGLATKLGVSTSYLNLLENDRRPLTTDLLLKLARMFELDLRYFSDDDAHLVADVTEVFGDAVFEDHPLTGRDVAEFVANAPDVARAVVRLHQAYTHVRTSAEALAQRVLEDQDGLETVERARLSSEQVSDLLHRHENYFPTLETAAESLWREAALRNDDVHAGLVRFIEQRYRTTVSIVAPQQLGGAVRRFDPVRHTLQLSSALHSGSRTFQLAVQVGLLHCHDVIAAIIDEDPLLTSDDARALGRVVLAAYFAGAVMMPYAAFLHAAEDARYDVELLGQQFRTSFEQTCHRLTTLRRPGMRGVNFYFVRVDMAGNISKQFSSAGIRFPRFSGLCPLWNVHAAFLQPGVVRVQISKQLDGTTVFAVARTVRRHVGAYHAPTVLYSVGIGCDLAEAHKLVYADGIDLLNPALAVPIGITCRLCERTGCQARAFPSVHQPLRVDENVRGVSFFATPEE